MTDYNLGRASGRITVDVDKRAFRRAEGSLDDVNRSARRVAEGFEEAQGKVGKYDRQTRRATGTTEEQARALDRLNKKTEEATKASEERRKAEADLQDIMEDSTKNEKDIEAAIVKANKAKGAALRIAKERKAAERDLARIMAGIPEEKDLKVNVKTEEAHREISRLKKALSDLDRHGANVLTRAGKVGLRATGATVKGGSLTAGVGALGGIAGLLGGGGITGVVQVGGALASMSGALGAIPGIAGAAAFGIQTVNVATMRFADSLKDLGTDDFAKAIKDMAPAAQEVAIELNSLVPVFKNVQTNVEQAFFQPLQKKLFGLADTYVPVVQSAMTQVANIIGRTGASLADWLMAPEQQRTVQDFLANVQEGLSRAVEAAQPLLQAITDVMSVSGQFLPEIGQAFADGAKELADFIRQAKDNGQLFEWIREGLDKLHQFLGSLKNFAIGLAYIGKVSSEFSADFISMLDRVSKAFLEWTQSVEGQNALAQFFQSMSQASQTLTPLLGKLGTLIVGTILPGLANLGTAIGPGISFLIESLGPAFHDLFQSLLDSAPAINGMISGLAIVFADIIRQVGPTLPGLLKSLADLFYNLGIAIGPAANLVVTGVTKIIEAFNTKFSGLVDAIKTGLETGDWSALSQWITDTFKPLATQAIDIMIAAFREAKPQIEAVAGEIFDAIKNKILDDIQANAESWGKKIVEDLLKGMLDGIPGIGPVARMVMDAISDWFPHSPAKKGPFSGRGWTKYRGMAIMDGLAEGMLAGAPGAGNAASTAVGKTSAGMNSGISGLVNDVTELTSFGQKMLDFAKGIGDIVFNTIKVLTTDFSTGQSTIKKSWTRNVTDADLARKKADADFRKSLTDKSGEGPTIPIPDSLKRFADSTKVPGSSSQSTVKPSAPGAIDPASGKQGIANYIIDKAMSLGYSRKQADEFVIQAVGESGLDPLANGGNQDGTGAVRGIFQFTPGTWGDRPGSMTNAKDNIDAYFELAAQRGLTPDTFTQGSQLGTQVSIGGPWHPQNAAKGHLTNATAAAQQYLDAYKAATQAAVDDVLTPLAGLQMEDIGNGFFKDKKTGEIIRQVGSQYYPASDLRLGADGKPLLDSNGKPIGLRGQTTMPPPGASPGGGYGLKPGTNIDYGAAGFPPWVYAVAQQFGLQASTYSGHQESNRNEAGYAPNPMDLNRGIDWSGSVENMQKFAEWLQANGKNIPGLEQVIFQNPNSKQKIGFAGGSDVSNTPYFASDYAGHQDHVHTRQSQPIQLPDGSVVIPPGASPGIGSAISSNPFGRKVATDDPTLQALSAIQDNTKQSALTDDAVLQEFLTGNSLLSDQIRIGKDSNSTDDQVAASLSAIDDAVAQQRQLDTPQSRYIADQLTSVQNEIAGNRGFGVAQNPVDAASGIAQGAFGVAGDVFKIIDGVMKSVDSASQISSTLVRGIENTEDIMKIIDNVQTFIELAQTIAQTVTDGLNLASSIASIASAAGPFGGQAAGGLQAASAISSIVTSVISSVNAGIDLAQEAYRIGSKYWGKFISYLAGGGDGSLMGDVKFLLDQNDWTLKTWSEENPDDKRSRSVPGWLQNDSGVQERGGKIRDLNMYIGPGTDPNEAMNEGMWRIQTDQGGVFSSEY